MSSDRGLLASAARALSVLLALAAAIIGVYAVWLYFSPAADSAGVLLTDSLFGCFILFTAARFLWIYASRMPLRKGSGRDQD